MDWGQASGIEYFVFCFGALSIILLCGLIVSTIIVFASRFVLRKIDRHKRLKKTTHALWCGKCCNNIDGRCERFNLDTEYAPVRRPGCSWGIEKKE